MTDSVSRSTMASKVILYGTLLILLIGWITFSRFPSLRIDPIARGVGLIVCFGGMALSQRLRSPATVRKPANPNEQRRFRQSYLASVIGALLALSGFVLLIFWPSQKWGVVEVLLVIVGFAFREAADWLYRPFVIASDELAS